MDEVRDGIAPRIQLVTTEVRVVPVVQGAELLGRRLAGGARPDGGPGIPHELHRHVARGVVADLARRPGTEPTVQRSAWQGVDDALDRKSTRLNSSHRCISYAVFCLKKKKKKTQL